MQAPRQFGWFDFFQLFHPQILLESQYGFGEIAEAPGLTSDPAVVEKWFIDDDITVNKHHAHFNYTVKKQRLGIQYDAYIPVELTNRRHITSDSTINPKMAPKKTVFIPTAIRIASIDTMHAIVLLGTEER